MWHLWHTTIVLRLFASMTFPNQLYLSGFDLVYMVDFIAIAVCTAADFTDFGLQTFLEGGCVVRIAIRQIGHFSVKSLPLQSLYLANIIRRFPFWFHTERPMHQSHLCIHNEP